MSEQEELRIDTDFINKLYMMAQKTPPENGEISLDTLKELADSIDDEMKRLKIAAGQRGEKFHEIHSDNKSSKKNTEDVLIIDDLCIITYQLGVLFKNLGYHVTVAKDIYDAIAKYNRFSFDLVIMDLFLPTDKEGFILLEELIKLRSLKKLSTKIGVMTASAKEEHKQGCLNRGADFFVEKTEDWQKHLVQAAKGEEV